MNLNDRFEIVWRNKQRSFPVPKVSVGRAAELQVASLLDERVVHSSYDYVAGPRVPGRKRRHEIDFVITTPNEIWLVELKNWSGFVGLDGGHVIQHRSGGRGVVDHGRLISDLRRKERALRNYLRPRVREVPTTWTVLVFYNRSVALSEELVATDDMDVVRLPEFMSALPPPDSKNLEPVSDAIKEVRPLLAALGSWDLMALHGGQIVSGDLVGISVDELQDRDRFERLRTDVPRSILNIFRKKLQLTVRATERSGAECEFDLGFDETVRFHCAGQPRPEQFSLRDVEAIKFGYTS